MSTLPIDPAPALPTGFTARVPTPDDLPRMVELVSDHRQRVRGDGSVDEEALTAQLLGPGSWTRRQVVVEDDAGRLVAWAEVHDRAAGRTMVWLTVEAGAEVVAPPLLAWEEDVARVITAERGITETRLDALVDVGDRDEIGWFLDAGYVRTRSWLNMTRPVSPDEELPAPREGVQVRRVGVQEVGDGTTFPVAADLQAVHRMLEESFEDHFNSYRESFPEFVQRLREDPGHRWDHWWLALVEDQGEWVAGGALVASVVQPDASGKYGSYVDYIGVHRRARGRGVAKALLHTVIEDAARRDRNRVGLEVDADSPTHADGLYRALGWENKYVTESWNRDIRLEE
ncbi:MAG TPA: GNAT family N-acetyltransferase [Nocardioidaceae bacterium]|nr:GNAT family N-acetyltransferase [Nocardioidaceae bacterium]